MEKIYNIFSGNATREINIKEYFNQYKDLINSQKLNEFPMLSKADIKKYEKSCCITKLDCNENKDSDNDNTEVQLCKLKASEIPDSDLETLQHLKKRLKEIEKNGIKTDFKCQGELAVSHVPTETGPKAIPLQDIFLFIRIYNPFIAKHLNTERKRDKLSLSCVISILGQQTLSDLRDCIRCSSDLSIVKECSDKPLEFTPTMNKDQCKSGFFCIENTFYNDLEDRNNLDYSIPIREWACSRGIGPFEVASMENTRMDSLIPKFGFPWVYRHQGNCEHLIVFSDARFVNSDDDLAIKNYPRVERIRQQKSQCCMMCSNSIATWIVTNGSRLPNDPCFFCKNCFFSYNYINKKKVGTFKAYHFPVYEDLWNISNSSMKKD